MKKSPRSPSRPPAKDPLAGHAMLLVFFLIALAGIMTGYGIYLRQSATPSTPIGQFPANIVAAIAVALVLGASYVTAAVRGPRIAFRPASISQRRRVLARRLYRFRWSNPLLWVGAFVPALVYLLAALHSSYPSIPLIDLHIPAGQWDILPLNAGQSRIYFAAVGIGCLLPSRISFSLWFFPLLNGLGPIPSAHANHGFAWRNFPLVVALFTTGLLILGALWPVWPLNPLGLVLVDIPVIQSLWPSLAIGWAFRLFLRGAGGTGALRRARPFLIGLILGECFSATLCSLIALTTHTTPNTFFPPP